MPGRYRPIESDPSKGSILVTNTSLDRVGFHNYSTKRNWRSVRAGNVIEEVRREGYDYFWPNMTNDGVTDFTTDPGDQPFPNEVTETAVTELKRETNTGVLTFNIPLSESHIFVVGEQVAISGANETEYNYTFTITKSGRNYINFDLTENPSYDAGSPPTTPATGTILVKSDEKINLLCQVRRPNGDHAVIAGTPTRIFRFTALGGDGYFEDDYVVAAYVDDEPAEWKIIGNGYNPNGNRWEAVLTDGYAIFNNGKDLPFTYRVEETEVKPIYEMREQAIASVGTTGQYAGTLMCGDIRQIIDDKLEDSLGLIGDLSFSAVLVSQASNTATFTSEILGRYAVSITRSSTTATVTAPSHGLVDGSIVVIGGANEASYNGTYTISNVTDDTFDYTVGGSPSTPATGDIWYSNYLGKWIELSDGDTKKITAITDLKTATVGGAAETLTNETFRLRTLARQTGSTFSDSVTATQSSGSTTVTASSSFFTPAMVGDDIRYANGWRSEIVTYNSGTEVVVDDPAPADFTAYPFYIVSRPNQASADFVVSADSDVFRPEMVDRFVSWDTGRTRRIVQYSDPRTVYVDYDTTIPTGFMGVVKEDSYKEYSKPQFINHIHYRVNWSDAGAPRRWAASVPCKIDANSNILTLKYPAKSFETGQEVIVLGAGVDGGNLTATLKWEAANRVFLLSKPASTEVTYLTGSVAQSDSTGSFSAHEDLQDDSASVVRIAELENNMLVMKEDSAFFLGTFLGTADRPWDFRKRTIPPGTGIYYRNTLERTGANSIAYVGIDSIYTFDLTTQSPKRADIAELCKSVFFDQATIASTNDIFTANNKVTNEIFLFFPSSTSDKALVFDYKTPSSSTTSLAFTAAATINKPVVGAIVGETEDWFLMATEDKVVVVYGKSMETVDAWGGVKAIYYTRASKPYQVVKTDYDSVLKSGLNDFGDSFNEKVFRSYLPVLSSLSPDTTLSLNFYGARNSGETPTSLLTSAHTVTAPWDENLVPIFFKTHLIQDEITVDGTANIRLSKRIWEVAPINSRSMVKASD